MFTSTAFIQLHSSASYLVKSEIFRWNWVTQTLTTSVQSDLVNLCLYNLLLCFSILQEVAIIINNSNDSLFIH